jgi:predicted nucleic acid-binding protein
MKGLDTSVLLGLLAGEPSARGLLRRLRGVELATTEANLLELTLIANRAPARVGRSRRDALKRLRRKITVIPIDARAVEQATRHLQKGAGVAQPLVLAMLGALEATGCDEFFTQETAQDLGKWKFKVSRLGYSKTK